LGLGAAVIFAPSKLLKAETPATASETQAVLEPVQRLFDGIAKPDVGIIRAQLIPEGSATLYRNGEFLQMSLKELADRLEKIIGGPDRFEEHIHDPLVRIDDNIAVVWAAYDATKNGKIDHCGTDLLSLVRRDGHWIIASVTDNSRRTCSAK
jgi:putative lumazine-binding protein